MCDLSTTFMFLLCYLIRVGSKPAALLRQSLILNSSCSAALRTKLVLREEVDDGGLSQQQPDQ